MSRVLTESGYSSTPNVETIGITLRTMGRPKTNVSRYPEFAARFQRAVNESGFVGNQEALAKNLRTSKASVSNWGGGDKLPSMGKAVEIADILDISVVWLLQGKGPMRIHGTDGATLDVSHLSPDAKVAIQALVHSFEQPGNGNGEKKAG